MQNPHPLPADIEAVRREMLRFAVLQLRDEAAAEDAVQEALLGALTGRQGFEGRAALKTWVFGILKHKLVDLLRQRQRTVNISALAEEGSLDEAFEVLFKANGHWTGESAPRTWEDPEASLAQRQFWQVFEACLTGLPENTARIFMMREFLELETAEICATQGLKPGNCHVILHRARMSLRLCLEMRWFGGEK